MNKDLIKLKLAKNAISLFNEKGYDNVSVDEITSCCHKTRTFFYHYFKSKEDLFVFFSEIEKNNFEKTLKSLENEFVGEPQKRLRKLLIDKMTLIYYSECYRVAVKDNLFDKIDRIGLLLKEFEETLLNMYIRTIEEGVRLGIFISYTDMQAFLQFYQKMQKGIEPTFVDDEKEDLFLYKYSTVVDLSIKAITKSNQNTTGLLEDIY
jgi:AcrR family transcriptional regulator